VFLQYVREQTGNQPSTPWHSVKTESAKMNDDLVNQLQAAIKANKEEYELRQKRFISEQIKVRKNVREQTRNLGTL
jgi:gas vesicle protein